MNSPYQLLYGHPPSYDHLRIFGCVCYPWQKPVTSHKLQPRAPQCIFLGYSDVSKGYRCFNPITGKTVISRHVVFDESTFPQPPTTLPVLSQSSPPPTLLVPVTASKQPPCPPLSTPVCTPHLSTALPPNSTTSLPSLPIPAVPPANSLTPTSPSLPESPQISLPPPRIHPMQTRLQAGITKPKTHFNLHSSLQSELEPQTYLQAANHPQWRKAMSDEFLALQQQGTWSLVPSPPDANVIGCRWTFRLKRHADGSIARYKARLVAQGFTQEFGTDFSDTFSPVARLTTIRLFLTVAVTNRWEILQCDVSNAFLHGRLDHTLYMHQPPGFQDVDLPNHVCLLHKAIYGLKQAPRLWYATFSTHLQRHGFQVSTADSSLLFYKTATTTTFLILYVDDILVAGNNPEFITHLFAQLNSHFHMKPLGPLSSFLGINFIKTKTGLLLNQPTYIQDLLHTAGLHNSKPVQTPATLKALPKSGSDLPFPQPTHYRRLTGSLQYLTITRPDIAYAVNLLCQHMQTPTVHHFQLLKRVLRYLQATPTHGLPISTSSLTLTAFSDADWAGDADTRRSTSGFCIYLGSTLVSWRVHKQKTVARSSTEAEYRALAAATTEVI